MSAIILLTRLVVLLVVFGVTSIRNVAASYDVVTASRVINGRSAAHNCRSVILQVQFVYM